MTSNQRDAALLDAPPAPPLRSLHQLRWVERLHVRASLLFGVPIVALLLTVGVVSYRVAVERQLDALRGTLMGLSVGLAESIHPEDVEALRSRADEGSPPFRRLRAHFEAVARMQPKVKSIYVLRGGAEAATLSFALDWVRRGRPARVGDTYDPRQAPGMLRGFHGPSVERDVYTDAWGRNLSAYAPIRDAAGRVIAIVGVDISANEVDALERRALVGTAVVLAIALAFLVVGGAVLGQGIRRPLAQILAATDALAAGELEVRTGLERRDELGILAQRIDALARDLGERDKIRDILGRYVSPDVARRVLGEDGAGRPKARRVTALFVDIRGYSTLSEKAAPAEVVEVLNAYFAAMLEIVDQHGGCVIELLGDAILAVFGAPEPLADHPAAAILCARAMRERLAELNDEWDARGVSGMWKERGLLRLEVRAGIHTDTVVAGTFGTERRAKYAVLGRAVNFAIELESLNKALGSSILFSDRTRAALPTELVASATDRGEHSLRGMPLRVYSI